MPPKAPETGLVIDERDARLELMLLKTVERPGSTVELRAVTSDSTVFIRG